MGLRCLPSAARRERRIEGPKQFPCRRLERLHLVSRWREVHHAIHHDRRALDHRRRAGACIAGLVRPSDFQLRDVTLLDLAAEGIARRARVPAIVIPLFRPPRRTGSLRPGSQCCRSGGLSQKLSAGSSELEYIRRKPGSRIIFRRRPLQSTRADRRADS